MLLLKVYLCKPEQSKNLAKAANHYLSDRLNGCNFPGILDVMMHKHNTCHFGKKKISQFSLKAQKVDVFRKAASHYLSERLNGCNFPVFKKKTDILDDANAQYKSFCKEEKNQNRFRDI